MGLPGSSGRLPGAGLAAGGSMHWGSSGGGGHAGFQPPARGAAATLNSQLTRELESARDELLVKADEAEGLASQVGQGGGGV